MHNRLVKWLHVSEQDQTFFVGGFYFAVRVRALIEGLTVHLKAGGSFCFSHTVLWNAGVRALVLSSYLTQAQAVVTAELKSANTFIEALTSYFHAYLCFYILWLYFI